MSTPERRTSSRIAARHRTRGVSRCGTRFAIVDRLRTVTVGVRVWRLCYPARAKTPLKSPINRWKVGLTCGLGADSGVVTLAYAAWNLWQLGWPDRALAHAREAVVLARQLGNPFSSPGFTESASRVRRGNP
jgi:hypothetical protein